MPLLRDWVSVSYEVSPVCKLRNFFDRIIFVSINEIRSRKIRMMLTELGITKNVNWKDKKRKDKKNSQLHVPTPIFVLKKKFHFRYLQGPTANNYCVCIADDLGSFHKCSIVRCGFEGVWSRTAGQAHGLSLYLRRNTKNIYLFMYLTDALRPLQEHFTYTTTGNITVEGSPYLLRSEISCID